MSRKFDEEHIKACKILCKYLNVKPKIPTKDIADNFSNLKEEILYLSGIRYNEVILPEKWWKQNNGAMLGKLKNGTPVALLPNKISGYSVYDPVQEKTYKVTAKTEIELTATAVFRTLPTKKIKFSDIINFILGENMYKEIAIIFLCSFLASVIQLIPPFVAAEIFDVIIPQGLRIILVEMIFLLLAFAIANMGFEVLINLAVTRIKTKGSVVVQAALWDRLVSLRVPFFYKFTTGELLQKVKNIEHIKNMVSLESLQAIVSNLFAFIYIIALYNFNSSITRYVLMMFVVLFIVYFLACKRKYKLHKNLTFLENQSMSFSHQIVRGIHRIKVSGAKSRLFNKWSILESKKRRVMAKITKINNALKAFHMFFDIASTGIVFLLVIFSGDINVGVFIAYTTTFFILRSSVGKLLRSLNILPELISACTNIAPILEYEPEYNSQKLIPKDMSGTIEVNHAIFRYEQYGRTILNDISFRIEEGESVGIVGLSGGGKSTLLKLLMGFYELTDGKIYYGGYDLQTIDMRYLRSQMGIVLQNGALTAGDIFSNIADNDATEETVMEALRIVDMEEKINSLPQGLATKMENCPFSEGEKQKILIAHAIVRKNKFLFMDEATHNLDNVSQNTIIKNLSKIPATKIIIAQRLATVQYCDKIIVLGEGKILKMGIYSQIIQEK
ncbi:MAG: ATP-binding cassette domain-containing protein [Defluviitaleaceae bacterium]|nr:ATP-binding cassette domain-containing protein [Defluviitaleaceae bacterium]